MKPVLTETCGRIVTEWYCEPPQLGSWFRIGREEWRGDVRMIYAWLPEVKPPKKKPRIRYYRCGDYSLFVVPAWE